MARIFGREIPRERLSEAVRRVVLQDGILRGRQGTIGPGTELRAIAENRFKPFGAPQEIRFEPTPGGGMRMIAVIAGTAKPIVYERVAEFKPTPEQLAEYAGEYRSGEIEPIYRMVVRDGKLSLERLKAGSAALEPAVKDLFTGPMGSIRFVRDEKGEISGFVLSRGRILNFRLRKVGAGPK